jgi:hypothetical protein
MTRTVDLAIVGMTTAGSAAAVYAARRGKRVLVVTIPRDGSSVRALRRSLKAAGEGCQARVSVLTGVEVVWIDGTSAVEVVLLRQIATGRLLGINTSAVLLAIAVPAGIIAPAIRELVLKRATG